MQTGVTYRVNNTDGQLYAWNDINNQDSRWESILIGNGASINVWSGFRYPSIYSHATSAASKNPLSPKDVSLFASLNNTHNFEQVLFSLKIASMVNRALGLPDTDIVQRYDSIKQSLIGTIGEVHIPWKKTPDQIIEEIRKELLNYKNVYATNYDLLIYWAVMYQDNPAPFVDYFFNGVCFDSSNTDVYYKSKTRVLYLHGALHLYRMPLRTTLKRKAQDDKNLLDLLAEPFVGYPDAVPLLVSEGESTDKLFSISQSDYLTFAYDEFMKDQDDIVVFGHSLSDSDKHITDALKKKNDRRIAIALLPPDPTDADAQEKIVELQASFRSKLPRSSLYFFDATTHPLGSPAHKVTP